MALNLRDIPTIGGAGEQEYLAKYFQNGSKQTMEDTITAMRQVLEGNKKAAEEGGRSKAGDNRFSRKFFNQEAQRFAAEIDTWKANEMPEGEYFTMGSTGEVLQGLGAIEQDIYMSGDKIKTILDEHGDQGITLDIIKQIPQVINDPSIILRAKVDGKESDKSTRMVMFGSVSVDGKPVLSVLDLKPHEGHIAITDMQKVTSAYIKDNEPIEFVKKQYGNVCR